MTWRILLPVFGFIIFSAAASDTPTQIFNRLMQNYDPNEAPGNLTGTSTNVGVGIYVNNIQFVGEKSMDITLSFYLRQRWLDPRLRFASADVKTKDIRPPPNSWNQIWVPDTFIRSSTSAKIADDLSPNRLFRFNSTGHVWYVSKMTAVLPCRFDVRRYPFDKQECKLTFESFGYMADTLYYSPMPSPIDVDMDITMSLFRLINTSTADCSQNYTTGRYPCMEISFAFQRNSRHFVLQFFLPSIIFVIVSWLAFWTDLEISSVARLFTGILTLIALVLLNALAGHSALVVPYATSADCWTFVCYVFVFATLVEYAVVSVLSKKPSGVRGVEYLKPPFVGTEKTIEAKEKSADGSSGDGKRKARLVDWFSRICFPVAFLLFNLIYWIVNAR